MQRDQRQPGQPQDQRAARLDPGQRQVLATAGFALAELDVSGAKTLVDNSLPRCQLFHGASLVEYILKKVFIARDNLKGDVIAAGESGPFFPKVVAEKSVNGS